MTVTPLFSSTGFNPSQTRLAILPLVLSPIERVIVLPMLRATGLGVW